MVWRMVVRARRCPLARAAPSSGPADGRSAVEMPRVSAVRVADVGRVDEACRGLRYWRDCPASPDTTRSSLPRGPYQITRRFILGFSAHPCQAVSSRATPAPRSLAAMASASARSARSAALYGVCGHVSRASRHRVRAA